MLTQTAIATAITAMGSHRDPMKYMSDISGIVEHYSASISRGNANITVVMEMAAGIKANFAFLDNDISELQTHVAEAEDESFSLSANDASTVIVSMNDLLDSVAGAVKVLNSLQIIISHMNTFHPHQAMVDNVLKEGLDKLGIMEKSSKRIIVVCDELRNKASVSSATPPNDHDTQNSVFDEEFRQALSVMASLNHDTLKALADR